MGLIFDHCDAAAVCVVDNQHISGLKLDIVATALELGHQIGSPVDYARPTSDVVEDLVDNVVGNAVEEVLALNEFAQCP
jgi:hypothetical protein